MHMKIKLSKYVASYIHAIRFAQLFMGMDWIHVHIMEYIHHNPYLAFFFGHEEERIGLTIRFFSKSLLHFELAWLGDRRGQFLQSLLPISCKGS